MGNRTPRELVRQPLITMLRYLLVFLPLLLCCASPEPEPERPNILWLVAEDLSPTIPAFGDSTVVTPHLSRLADEGIRFTRTFSVSGVCAPSRFSLATGIYTTTGRAHHMRTNAGPIYHAEIEVPPYEALPPPDVRMMSEILRSHGYYVTNNAKEDYQFSAPVTAWDESSRSAHWRNRPDGAPFFSVINFGVTHESRIWAKAEDSLWIAPNLDVPIPPYLPTTAPAVSDVRRMYSNIRELDSQIGDVLAALEEDGLLDSTIIFFYSDHGGPLPRQKRQLYDSGLHVPLIVRFPDGLAAGTIDDQLVSFVDFAPTVFSLTGMALPEYLEGQAFLGPQKSDQKRTYVHAAADRFDAKYDTKRAVRDARYKYIRNLQPERGYYLAVSYREQMATMQELLRLRDAGELDSIQAQWFRSSKPEHELFDTWEDPFELVNLAADPGYEDKLAELSRELDQWMHATNDPGTMDENAMLETMWPGKIQPVTAAPTYEMADDLLHLQSNTEGASIGYRLPTEEQWQLYTGPIQLENGSQVQTVAHRIGFAPSDTLLVPQ